MPQIPIQTPTISPDVPSLQSPRASTAIDQAISNVGQAIAGSALSLNDEIKKSEAEDASATAVNQDKLDSEQYMSQLKLNSPDGYIHDSQTKQISTNSDGTPRTISQEYRDWANSRYEQNQKVMPSKMAQELYKSRASGYLTSQVSATKADEQTLQIESFKTKQLMRDQSRADNIVSFAGANPTKGSQMAYSASQDSRRELYSGIGTLWSKPVADEQALKQDQQYAESTGRSAVNQVNSIPKKGDRAFDRKKIADEWIALLTEDETGKLSMQSQIRKEHGLPILADMFNPDTKAAILAQLKSVQTQATSFDHQSIQIRLEQLNAATRNRDTTAVDPTLIPDIRAGIATVNPSTGQSEINPLKGALDIGSITMYKEFQKVDAGTKFLPASQMDPVLEKQIIKAKEAAKQEVSNIPGSETIGQTLLENGREYKATYIKKVEAEAQADWTAFVNSNTSSGGRLRATMQASKANYSNPNTLVGMGPMVQQQLAASENLYSYKYPNDPSHFNVLEKPQAEQISSYLTDIKNSIQDRAKAVRTLSQVYGPSYNRIISEMVEDKKLDQRWLFAGLISGNQTQTEDIIAAITDDPKSNVTTQFLSAQGISEKDLDAQIGGISAKFLSGVVQQSPGDPLSNLRQRVLMDTIKVKAINLMRNNRASNPNTAVTQAYDALIGNNWHLKQSTVPETGFLGIGRRNYPIVIAKSINGNKVDEATADQVATYASNVMTPQGLKNLGAVPPRKPGGAPTEFNDEFYKQVATDDGRAVMNSKTGNLEIWYWDRNLRVDRQITDKDGKPLSVPFRQMVGNFVDKPVASPKKYQPGKK